MRTPFQELSLCCLLLAFFLLLAACAKEAACQPPYILHDGGCCMDGNGDGACDPAANATANGTTNATAPAASAPVVHEKPAETTATARRVYTEEEKESLARPFAAKVALAWNSDDWNGLYPLIPAAERAILSDKRFRFLMRISDLDLAVDKDPRLAYVFKSAGFDGLAKARMVVDNVTVSGDAARVDVKTWVRDVRLPYGPLHLVWEQDGWRVRANGTFYAGTGADGACSATGYADYCFSEYAQAFDDIAYCDKAGVYVVKCYAHFHEEPSAGVVIQTCADYSRKWQNDDCLLAVALETGNGELCPPMDFEYDTYRCLGIIDGFQDDMAPCLDAINRSSNTAGYDEDNCYYGYALAKQDSAYCKHDWTDDDLRGECYKIR